MKRGCRLSKNRWFIKKIMGGLYIFHLKTTKHLNFQHLAPSLQEINNLGCFLPKVCSRPRTRREKAEAAGQARGPFLKLWGPGRRPALSRGVRQVALGSGLREQAVASERQERKLRLKIDYFSNSILIREDTFFVNFFIHSKTKII